LLLTEERLIAKMVANQPTIAMIIAPETAVGIIDVLL
jgi:hypothetical protein